jgi:hypothetical protein
MATFYVVSVVLISFLFIYHRLKLQKLRIPIQFAEGWLTERSEKFICFRNAFGPALSIFRVLCLYFVEFRNHLH